MNRGIIYPGQVPLETDLLYAQQQAMVGLSKLAAAVLGTSTLTNGLAVTQTGVASMNVQVAPGEIYAMANLEATAYSSLALDATHTVLKQGVLLDAALLALTAPGTAGFSVNYLIQATFAEVDGTPVTLPYYNASNPSTAYSGPANAGTAQNTRRLGSVVLSAKAGTAATTGSQTTPAPDSGYVGIAVVTVANGAVTVVNGNISVYASIPTLPYNLNQIANGLGSSLSGSGYQKLPSGLIIQWGTGVATSAGAAFTFPLTFPTVCYSFSVSNNGGTSGYNWLTTSLPSTTGGTMQSSTASNAYSYIAIGK